MFNKKIAEVAGKILAPDAQAVSNDDAYILASLPAEDTLDLIFLAHKIKRKHEKQLILCSIINAKSGYCTEDCAFCAQSSHHKTGINTYDLLRKEEMVDSAIRLYEAGATRYSMVTSGYMLTDEEVETVCGATAAIREKTDLKVCASLGMLTLSTAKSLKKGGISVYHHNLETSRSFFKRVCTTHDYEEDIETVKLAKLSGMKVCSGGILGLGETWEQRVELAVTLRELNVDGIPLNFLNPIAGTKMEKMPLLSPTEALKCIALFRIINPDKDILICGGREVTLVDYQSWIMLAGANGVMIGNYLTTQGRNVKMDMDMVEDGKPWLI